MERNLVVVRMTNFTFGPVQKLRPQQFRSSSYCGKNSEVVVSIGNKSSRQVEYKIFKNSEFLAIFKINFHRM